jgi:hypothetical protein
MSGAILYPRMSHKNMSRDTRREFESTFGISLEDVPIWSQIDWSKTYHFTGHKIGGVSEMRQKWYPSGAKPRTYYCQGGTHYQSSCHLQDPFTVLVNSNPITHHIHRLQPNRLILKEGCHYRIYDLISFTSRMDEQKNFLDKLSSFSSGVIVYVLDLRIGLIPTDLGELLWDYNQLCANHPEVSYERISKDIDEDWIIGDHARASMLGIFGNLMSCTFAHAALIAQCIKEEDQVNVAGDDGIIEETPENEGHIDICICALGDYERSKTFRSDDEGCICLKRPLWEEPPVLQVGIACIPPSITLVTWHLFGIGDPRYTFLEDGLSRADRISIVGKDLMRFLRSVHRAQWKLDDSQVLFATEFVRRLTVKASLPLDGRLGHCGDEYFWPASIEADELRVIDPLKSLVDRRYHGHVILPVQDYEEIEEPIEDWDQGDVLRGNKTRIMGLLEKLGYIRTERALEVSYDHIGYNHLFRLFTDRSTPLVYNVYVLKAIPRIFH